MNIHEEWRAVPGLQRIEVSSLGNVRGSDNPPFTTSYGYRTVTHQGAQYAVHRLVCTTWHGPAPDGKPLALHYDDKKTNNAAANLRWGDSRENMEDAKRNGIAVGPAGWRTAR